MRKCLLTIAATMVILIKTSACPAVTYVMPKIGGDQVGHSVAPMIMPEIYFDGNDLLVLNSAWNPWPVFDWDAAPVLRPLTDPNKAFDPSQPWAVLTDKAYNFQYGWDSGLLDEMTHPFPDGGMVWVRLLDQTAGIETYYKDGASDPMYGTAYMPLFGTPDANNDPSPDIWRWNKGMRHNVYAIPKTYYGRLWASYIVYVGDANGTEMIDTRTNQVYGSSTVTLRWTRPCPYVLTGDMSLDCRVDFTDAALMAAQWSGQPCSVPDGCDKSDIDQSGAVDYADMGLLAGYWLADCFVKPPEQYCIPR